MRNDDWIHETISERGRRGGAESVSVIVSSYRQPRALEITLTALADQSRRADEIIVTDDGSDTDTFEVVERMQTDRRLPTLRVFTQPDRGFRKTVALNKAILASAGQQLLFLDGDVVPHRHWIAHHCAAYRPMGYAVGDYARPGLEESRALASCCHDSTHRNRQMASYARTRSRHLLRRHNKAQIYIACRKPNRPRLLGGNFSVDRGLMFGVNGFEERFAGVGGEDSNIRDRFNRYGASPTSLIRAAVGLHLNPLLDSEQPSRNRTNYLDSNLRHADAGRRAQIGLAERMSGQRSPTASAAPSKPACNPDLGEPA